MRGGVLYYRGKGDPPQSYMLNFYIHLKTWKRGVPVPPSPVFLALHQTHKKNVTWMWPQRKQAKPWQPLWKRNAHSMNNMPRSAPCLQRNERKSYANAALLPNGRLQSLRNHGMIGWMRPMPCPLRQRFWIRCIAMNALLIKRTFYVFSLARPIRVHLRHLTHNHTM